jgi:hypothetical protein
MLGNKNDQVPGGGAFCVWVYPQNTTGTLTAGATWVGGSGEALSASGTRIPSTFPYDLDSCVGFTFNIKSVTTNVKVTVKDGGLFGSGVTGSVTFDTIDLYKASAQ